MRPCLADAPSIPFKLARQSLVLGDNVVECIRNFPGHTGPVAAIEPRNRPA